MVREFHEDHYYARSLPIQFSKGDRSGQIAPCVICVAAESLDQIVSKLWGV